MESKLMEIYNYVVGTTLHTHVCTRQVCSYKIMFACICMCALSSILYYILLLLLLLLLYIHSYSGTFTHGAAFWSISAVVSLYLCNGYAPAFFSWRKSALSEERLTWFELACIAPVIHNEAYEEHNKDQLEAGKSGLLQNDPIEPRPRTIENMLYESGSENEEEIMREIATSKTSLHRARKKQSRRADTEEVSHIYEDLPHRDDGKRSTRSPLPPPPTVPLPPPPPTFYMPFPPMLPPPMPAHPYHQMYLPYDKNSYMKVSPSFMSARTQQQSLPHPRSLKQPGLSHTSIPCIRSYGKSTNGIPPHPSSNFFQNLHDGRGKKRKLSQPSRLLRAAKSKLKKSPTVASRANSEPTPYATALELMDISPIHPPQVRQAAIDHSFICNS